MRTPRTLFEVSQWCMRVESLGYPPMYIRINRGSDVTICRQLSEQIVFLIATAKLKEGDALPSVRAMASRHKISRTTVSEAYKDLVQRQWIKGHRGKKMVVRAL